MYQIVKDVASLITMSSENHRLTFVMFVYTTLV